MCSVYSEQKDKRKTVMSDRYTDWLERGEQRSNNTGKRASVLKEAKDYVNIIVNL